MSEDVPEGSSGALAGFGPGSRIAGYVLAEQVGAGGMAVVFRAHDVRLDRQVALKILAPAFAADEAFRQRFIRESRAAAAVDDPHIIPVFEAGEADGVLFIAMRYVRDGDVRSLLVTSGPLPPARVAEIISQVSSALDAAHERGLVHRDVKPGQHAAGLPCWQRQARPCLPIGLRTQQGHSRVDRSDRYRDVPRHSRLHLTGADRAASRWTGARTSMRWHVPPSSC